MNAKGRIADLFFYTVVGTLFSFALCRAVLAATILQIPDQELLLLCLGFVAPLCAMCFNGRTLLFTLGGLLLAAILCFCYLQYHAFDVEWYRALLATIDELSKFIVGRLPYRWEYSRLLCSSIAFGAAFLTVLNTGFYFSFYSLVLIAATVITVPIYMRWGSSELAVTLTLLCLIVFLIRKLNLFAAGIGGSGHILPTLLILPAGLLLFTAAWLIPKPDLEIDGGTVAQGILDAADQLIYGMGDDGAQAFTEDGGKLGGAVSPASDETVMYVQADERLYLSGSVRDTYTGASWKSGDESRVALSRTEDGFFQTGEYTAELDRQQRYYMRYYGRDIGNVTIDLAAMHTRTIFTPPFRTGLWIPREIELQKNGLGSLSARRRLDMYTRYLQFYIAWDYQNPYFVDILRNQADSGLDTGAAKAEKADYLQLPEGLPRRVADLARELTAGYSNDYDRLKALEAYLREFPYTLTPPETPSGSDFVDHFLFGAREGYCVYYASAMAVMARSIGIPTRYVEGYVLPPEDDGRGRYVVTGAQAHAWVEAFFPGFGWVPFEPTGGEYAGNNTGEELPAPEPAPEQVYPEPEPLVLPPERPEPEPPEESPEPDDPEEPGKPPLPVPALTEENSQSEAMLPFAVVIAAGAALLLLRWRIRCGRCHRRELEALPERQRSIAYFARLLRVMGALGYPMLGKETAHAYAGRLAGEIPLQNVSLTEAAEIFAKASYSELPVSGQEADLVKRCYRELLGKLRDTRWGKLRAYWRHTVLDQI